MKYVHYWANLYAKKKFLTHVFRCIFFFSRANSCILRLQLPMLRPLKSLFLAYTFLLSCRILLDVHLDVLKPPETQHIYEWSNGMPALSYPSKKYATCLTLPSQNWAKSCWSLSLIVLKSVPLVSSLCYCSHSGSYYISPKPLQHILNCVQVVIIKNSLLSLSLSLLTHPKIS